MGMELDWGNFEEELAAEAAEEALWLAANAVAEELGEEAAVEWLMKEAS